MIIKNVKVVNFNKIIENADVEIKGNIIRKITRKNGKATKILVPGFIDEHIHGFYGMDIMDGKDAIEKISYHLAKNGTTGFLPTWITNTEKVMIDSIIEANSIDEKFSRVYGYHLEGPFISKEKKGAHNEKQIIRANKNLIKKLIDASDGRLKKMVVAPENFNKKFVSFLVENGVIVSIGHSNASASITREFINEGATSICHLWNAMSGVANRNPGIATEALNNEGVYCEMIFDLIHVDESTINLTLSSKGVEGLVAVTDAIRPAGLKDGESISGGLPIVKKGQKITLKGTDTIAGSAATMHLNFKNIISLGFDLTTAVSLTSYNQSLNLGLENVGQIKKGFIADIVLLDKNLEIDKVIINGEEVK